MSTDTVTTIPHQGPYTCRCLLANICHFKPVDSIMPDDYTIHCKQLKMLTPCIALEALV